jgi:hypothetical protein
MTAGCGFMYHVPLVALVIRHGTKVISAFVTVSSLFARVEAPD